MIGWGKELLLPVDKTPTKTAYRHKTHNDRRLRHYRVVGDLKLLARTGMGWLGTATCHSAARCRRDKYPRQCHGAGTLGEVKVVMIPLYRVTPEKTSIFIAISAIMISLESHTYDNRGSTFRTLVMVLQHF